MSRSFPSTFGFLLNRHPLPYWVLVAFLVLVFLVGGSSRADPQSLIIIRPAAVLFLAYAIWGLERKHIAAHRFLFALILATLCLTILYLIPLPPAIWRSLQNSNLLANVDDLAGTSQTWRPVSMVPGATWNALNSLFAPIATLILASRLDRESRFALLTVFLILGLIAAVLGLMQAVGPPDSALYFYRLTNGNVPVGLFANRNHFAVFLSCLFPMLAVYLSLSKAPPDVARLQRWLAIAFGTFLIPLILVTGSRAGLITTFLGILAIPLLYRKTASRNEKRKGRKLNPNYILGVVGVTTMAIVTVLAARAESFSRLFDDGGSSDMRFSLWVSIWNTAQSHLPYGSGAGSFAAIYQNDEPLDSMTFQYVPHAHNDWLEVVLTSGLPGAALIAACAIAFIFAAWCNFSADKDKSRDVMFGRLGLVIIGLLGVASVVDYPVRVPSIACLMAVAAIWASAGGGRLSKNTGSA